MKNIIKSTTLSQFIGLTKKMKYFYEPLFPKQLFLTWNKSEHQAYYKGRRPVPKLSANFHDCLFLPNSDPQSLEILSRDIINTQNPKFSLEHGASVWYNIAKGFYVFEEVADKLEKSCLKYKGMYETRAVFGALYGAIASNRQNIIQFLMNQYYHSCHTKFLGAEAYEIIEALNKNKVMTKQQKHQFWQKHFKQIFMASVQFLRVYKIGVAFKIFGQLEKFQYYDPKIWYYVINNFKGRKGWVRTTIIQRIYPYTGTFPFVAKLFNKYYQQLSLNQQVMWRYNLQELRLYSTQQMINKSQQNINLRPQNFTIFKQSANRLNRQYQRYLKVGNVKHQSQIIKDKSKSFGFAIKDKWTDLRKNDLDFGKLSKEDFEQLFGDYDEKLMIDKNQTNQQQIQNKQVNQHDENNEKNE